MMQAVGWMGQFRKWAEARDDGMRPYSITSLEPSNADEPPDRTLTEVFTGIDTDLDRSAARVLRLAQSMERYREFRKRRSVRLWRAEFAARGIDVSRLSDDEVERRVTDGCKRFAERLRRAGLSPEECADVMEGVGQGKLR
jgi:hypothetical protein